MRRYLILYKICICVGFCLFAFWFWVPSETTSHWGRPSTEYRAETYCFWPLDCPFPLVWKACVDCTGGKKIKGKKSPTVVSVPKKYKETNPDARIWGISSAMWLCPLTEGQKNIKGHNIWKLKVGILGALSVYAPPWHSRLTFNKQNLFSSI